MGTWSTQRKYEEENKKIENRKKFKLGEKKKGGKTEENKEEIKSAGKTKKKPEKKGSKEEKKDTLANVPIKTSSKLLKGQVSFLFVNKLFSDTNLSKHIEAVKVLDPTEAKKQYDVSSVKGKLLDKMIHDYKHTVSLTGLQDEPRSTSLITKSKLNKILSNYEKKRQKNEELSLKKYELYGTNEDDIVEIYNTFVTHRNFMSKRGGRFSNFTKRSRIDNPLLFMILNEYETLQNKRRMPVGKAILTKLFKRK